MANIRKNDEVCFLPRPIQEGVIESLTNRGFLFSKVRPGGEDYPETEIWVKKGKKPIVPVPLKVEHDSVEIQVAGSIIASNLDCIKTEERTLNRKETLRKLHGDNCCWCELPMNFEKVNDKNGATIEHMHNTFLGVAKTNSGPLRLACYECNNTRNKFQVEYAKQFSAWIKHKRGTNGHS